MASNSQMDLMFSILDELAKTHPNQVQVREISALGGMNPREIDNILFQMAGMGIVELFAPVNVEGAKLPHLGAASSTQRGLDLLPKKDSGQ